MGIIRCLFHAVMIEGMAIVAIIWFASSSPSPAHSSDPIAPGTRSVTGFLDNAVSNVSDAFSQSLPPVSQRVPYVESQLTTTAEQLTGAADRLLKRAIQDILE